MPEINGLTVQIAISAVASRIRVLETRLAQEIEDEDEEAGYTHQELIAYRNAAEDLRGAYNGLRSSGVLNLTPYEKLKTAVQD